MTSALLDGVLEPKLNPFAVDYLLEMLQAVVDAWTQIEGPTENEKENPITRRLAKKLIERDNLPYEVSYQYWLLATDGILDLRLRRLSSQKEYFAFEAKRLHVTFPGGKVSAEYDKYVGDDGMMAFVNESYSPSLPAGGMLGYVMDGDSARAWSGLGAAIEHRRAPLKLVVGSGLAESPLAGAVAATKNTRLGETDHTLTTHSLRLYHLLLPVGPA
jgi:hypothetical protein